MANVRQKSGTPTAEDFRSPDGTPVVVDAAAGIAYIIKTDNSIVAIGPSAGGVAITAAGGSVSSGTLVFSNGSGVSFGIAGQTLTASVAAGVPSPVNFSAGTTSGNLGSVIFSNANGVSFGLNGSTITGTVATNYQSAGAYLTTAMLSNAATISNINVSGGTTSNNLSNIVFSNSGGVSFGLNGSTLTATVATNYQSAGAYLTTAMLSNAATISNVNLSAGTTSNNLSAFVFSNSGGVSFGLNGSTVTATVVTSYQPAGAYLTTAAVSNHSHGVSFTSGSVAFQTLSFTNSNGISFNSGTQGIFGSHNAITTGALSDHSHGNPTLALTNLSGTTASASNGFTLSLSAAAGGGAVNFSAGTTSSGLGSVVFSNSNGVTFGLNGSTITASVAAGAAGNPMSYYENLPWFQGAASSLSQVSGSSIWVAPFILPHDISASFLRIPVSISHVSTISAGTSANTTFSNRRFMTCVAVIYSQGAGANSQSLQSVASASTAWTINTIHQNGTAGSQYTVSFNITHPTVSGGTTQFSTSYGASTSNYNVSSLLLTAFTGPRWIDLPFATSLSAGNYWIGLGQSTTRSTAGLSGVGAASFGFSTVGISQAASSIGYLGQATNSSIQLQPGLGAWTTNAFISATASIPINQISAQANNPKPYFQMIRRA